MSRYILTSSLIIIAIRVFSQLHVESDSLTMFMPGVISKGTYERDMAIAPGDNELYYTLMIQQGAKMSIIQCSLKSGQVTSRSVAPFSGKYNDLEPAFSPDGSRLYFCSNRPLDALDSSHDYNIWYVERQGNGWAAPIALGPAINTDKDEFYPAVTRQGKIYFTRENERGDEDIFCFQGKDQITDTASTLPEQVNTSAGEFNAYVSADDEVIIFSSVRPGDLGRGDLYACRKKADGSWTPAKNLGALVNSRRLDYSPYLSSNKKYLFFTSERMILPSSTRDYNSLETLEQLATSAGNGQGDLYIVPWDQVWEIIKN